MARKRNRYKGVRKGYETIDFKCTPKLNKRFLKGIKQSDIANNPFGCWHWQRTIGTNGYGLILIKYWKIKNDQGKQVKKRRTTGAHRYSWLYHNAAETIPTGLLVLHKCGNKTCVNPAHLKLGDHKENMKDMKIHGDYQLGSKHAKAKLTEQDVLEIRNRYATGEVSQRELSDEYGVNRASISFITRGETWKHVGGPRTKHTGSPNIKSRRYSDAQVREIRRRYKAGEPCDALGQVFGCAHQTIISIANRNMYRDVK